MGRVDGKVALVTGGAQGLGEAISVALAREGAHVWVTDINTAGAEAVAASIGDKATSRKLDVTSEEDWETVLGAIQQTHGLLNILVNNAGIVVLKTVEETTLEAFREINAINSEGVFLGIKCSIPLLKQSGNASIITIGSTASHLGYGPCFAYCASKGAIRQMTKSAAVHFLNRGYKIRINQIDPGDIESPEMQYCDAFPNPPREPREVPEGILGKGAYGAPDDVANFVVFVASDEARYITGANLLIDNGVTATPPSGPVDVAS